ncbi:GrpB family protein [Actinomycetospora aeridis]|uniref:GrpB family protein n=1 Tax=Actinomycetospora aeridis TaxID=3129231 RepID=A0ABU8N224_9PSEU
MSGTPPLILGTGPWLESDAVAAFTARASPEIRVVAVPEPVDPARAHLIVGGDARPDDGAVDARIAAGDPGAVARLWDRRVAPFAYLLARRQRAPRTQIVSVEPYDDAWPAAARRLVRRLEVALGERALRVEHVGSTSVPGMAGKDLVDLLVVVPDLDTVDALARDDWHRAGVVPVSGNLYGIDRHDREHPQRVAVDADPGRPLNVHLHPKSSPVWRELLAFRDWLRADPAHRDEYVDLKHRLAREADGDVNVYSRAKRTWINAAVGRALG